MDTYLLDYFLWRIALPAVGVIILVGVSVLGGRLKRRWAERKRMQAGITPQKISQGKFTVRKIQEWIRAGEYDIFVHKVTEQFHTHGQKEERVIYAEVEYRNQTKEENISCRRNQWHLFGKDGYSYEAKSGMEASYLYQEKRYFGSERFINPGMNVRGWLGFSVPEDAKITILQFMTAFIGTKTADIDVEHVIETEAQVSNGMRL